MWTRRTLLCTTGTAAAAGTLLPATAAHAADEYDTLRARWLTMINGSGYDPAAEPFRTALAWLAADAAAYRSTMSPADTPIWPTYRWAPYRLT